MAVLGVRDALLELLDGWKLSLASAHTRAAYA